MKRILLTATLVVSTFTSFSQSLGYKDLALLFSKDNHQGTARFNAMSGAFGALGGDVSVTNLNPAGLAVFNKSTFAITGGIRSTDISSNFYNGAYTTKNEYFSVPQAGGAFVFNNFRNSDWTRVVFGFNYQKTNDFRNSFVIEGNGGLATFSEFPLENDPKTQYKYAIEQALENSYTGEVSEFSVALSGAYKNKLYVGLGLNMASLSFGQNAYYFESNEADNGDVLNARLHQFNNTEGYGVSLSVGTIYKINQMFRVGLSYKSPTWYNEVLKETNYTDLNENEGDEDIFINNDTNNTYRSTFALEDLIYKLRTPSTVTLSGAVVLGKSGLISADYSYKSFSSISLSNADFSDVNPFFSNGLRNTHSLRVGGEYRVDDLSLRAGYSYEKNPNLILGGNTNKDNLRGFSLGAGYNFKTFKVDISYNNNEQISFYDMYHQPEYRNENIKPAELFTNNKVINATVVINL